MPITLKDVAARAGVTVTTVSRVINNRGPISEKTREKVYRVMRELNYQPNEAARSLAKKQTKIIGVIVPSVKNPFFAEVVEHLEYYASRKQYKIMLCNSYHQKEKEIEYIEMLKTNKVAGIIISSRTEGIEEYLGTNMPVVSFERVISNDISAVACDNYMGGVLATQCLLDSGCKYVGHIGGTLNVRMIADERRRGFVDVCEQAGVDYEAFMTEESQFETMNYTEFLENLLTNHPKMDGIFASSDIIAAELIYACTRRGIKIPQDMKIVGFDDINVATLVTPHITTVHQPLQQMCSAAIDKILDMKEKKNYLPSRTTLSVTLCKRETT
jgi:LacI family sucrose operon transcriptional repressor